jgi:hypothetical protein
MRWTRSLIGWQNWNFTQIISGLGVFSINHHARLLDLNDAASFPHPFCP